MQSHCLNCTKTLWEAICIFRNLYQTRREQNGWNLKTQLEAEAQKEITCKLQLLQKSLQGTTWNFQLLLWPLNSIFLLFSAVRMACKATESGFSQRLWPELPDPFWRLWGACVCWFEWCFTNNTWKTGELAEIFWQVYKTKHRLLSKWLFPVSLKTKAFWINIWKRHSVKNDISLKWSISFAPNRQLFSGCCFQTNIFLKKFDATKMVIFWCS